MDVGNPSNFERMLWLYRGDRGAMRRDVSGCRYGDDEVRDAIRRVYDARGYLLDPHSAIAYLGLTAGMAGQETRGEGTGAVGVFLATAHPAKFREIVEPIIGRPIDTPPPLADALARPRQVLRLEASLSAVTGALLRP